jgi:hypothetical protein
VAEPRRKTIWIRDADLDMWDELAEFATAAEGSMSEIISAALRQYEPFRIYRLGKEAGLAKAGTVSA